MLVKRGADLFEPESVKAIIAAQMTWNNSTKMLMVAAYKKFAAFNNIQWILPRYEVNRKLPFIPLEKEIDDLIASCGKKMATVLQLLKDTGMRIGEALDLQWIDIDLERKIILLNRPEKHGNARALRISDKLIAMLNRLPRVNGKVFSNKTKATIANNFNRQRKKAAQKLGNPRLLRIHFHTFRHWKATMEYHRTKDILYVMKLLGHKSISNTLVYTQLMEFEGDEYHSAVANSVDEAQKLIEAGFEYVCMYDELMLFRKRK
jgi:integrase